MKLKLDNTTAFWTALVSGILLFGQQIGNLVGFEISNELIAGILSALGTLLSVLVLLGVLTNSKEADTFEAKVFKKKK